MSEPAAARRPAGRAILRTRPGQIGRLLLPAVAVIVIGGGISPRNLALALTVGVGGAVAGAAWEWYSTAWWICEGVLHVRRGVFAPQTRRMPKGRVRAVELEQPPVHRALGIARVRVDGAAGESQGDAEVVIDALALEEARGLARDLLGHEPPRDAPVLARMQPSWHLLAPLTGAGVLAPLAAAAALAFQVGEDLVEEVGVERGQEVLDDAARDPLAALLPLLAITVVLLALGTLWSVVLNAGFTLTEAGGKLQTRRGIAGRTVTLDRARIAGWEWIEVLTARVARGGRLQALVTGVGSERAALLPAAPRRVALPLAHQLLVAPAPLVPRPRASLWIDLAAAVALCAGVAVALLVLGTGLWSLAPLLLLAVLAARALDLQHGSGHAREARVLTARSGSWRRAQRTVEIGEASGVVVRRGPLDRQLGLSDLWIATGSVNVEIARAAVEDVLEVGRALAPRCLLDATGQLAEPPQRAHPRGVWAFVIQGAFWSTLVTAGALLAGGPLWVVAVPLAGAALGYLAGWLTLRRARLGVDADGLVVRQGGFVRTWSAASHPTVQLVTLVEEPVERLLGLARVEVETASLKLRTPPLARDVAAALLDDLVARAQAGWPSRPT